MTNGDGRKQEECNRKDLESRDALDLYVSWGLLAYVHQSQKELVVRLRVQGQKLTCLSIVPPGGSCEGHPILLISTLAMCLKAETYLDPHYILLLDQFTGVIHRVLCSLHTNTYLLVYHDKDFSNSIIQQQLVQQGAGDSAFYVCSRTSFIPVKSLLHAERPPQMSPLMGVLPSQLSSALIRWYWLLLSGLKMPSAARKIMTLCDIDDSRSYMEMCMKTKSALTPLAKQLRDWAVVVQISVNVLLGMFMMYFLFVNSAWLAQQVAGNTNVVVNETLKLLEWLTGAPAGLKLNRRLTKFLGGFFKYHVWLWAEYLRQIGDHFDLILKLIGLCGFAGFTQQIALLQDLLSLLTLHIYCFYIYSARLYCLLVKSLTNLWRLFRGLKWNSLRNRVDHGSYDITQLFIGTLLFTICLFVLPTVALYYAVFGLFRWIIFMVQCCLDSIRYAVRTENTMLWIMYFLNSRFLTVQCMMRVMPVSSHSITVVELVKVKAAPYRECLTTLQLPSQRRETTWRTTLLNLATGDLI